VPESGGLLTRPDPDAARAAFAAGDTARRLAVETPDNLASLMGFFDRPPQEVTARLLSAISADGPGVTAAEVAALRLPVLVCGTAEDAVHPLALGRLIEAADLIEASGRCIVLVADGGIRDTTVPLLPAAGAETVVPGRSASVRRTRANGCAGCTGCRGQRRRRVIDAGWIFVRMRSGMPLCNTERRHSETGRT
jgi:hypothetical protein